VFRPTRRGILAGSAAAAVAALLLGTTAACGDGGNGDTAAPAAAGPRSVQHDLGTTEVPAQPKRIVSLSVTLTGHLLALDASVVASQVAPGPFSDKAGFFMQYAAKAAEKKVEVAYSGTEVDLEKVVGFKPDLIIGAASGADSSAKMYEQIKAIAPTLIYRYDNISWQDLTKKIGEAIGRGEQATTLLADFDAKVAAAKSAITVPAQEVAPIRDTNTDVVFFTAKSAQGQLMTALGLRVRDVPANLRKGVGTEGAREDIITVAAENLPPALGDASLMFVGHTAPQIAAAQAKPLWTSLPAVSGKRVYDLGLESFRMDYFSALKTLERLQAAF
jgi:ABC-type Fe2+-enterobactin transport system substrate-binding protein